MYYSCSQCRTALQEGQSACAKCSQAFKKPVPVFDDSHTSMYWPPAETNGFAAWLSTVPPAVQASVAAGFAVLLIAVSVGGSVIHKHSAAKPQTTYQQSAMIASVPPGSAPAAPSMPAPIVLEASPAYVPPQKSASFPSSAPAFRSETQSTPAAPAASTDNSQSAGTSSEQYAAARADADNAGHDAASYINSLTPEDYRRGPVSLEEYLSRAKQDRATMLDSPAVNPQDLAQVNADINGIQNMEDTTNRNRGPASIDMQ